MQPEDIKIEEVHPELVAVATEEPKSLKKFHKLTEKLLSKINGRMKGEREDLRKRLKHSSDTYQSNIENFLKNTNADLDKFKTRYEALYTDLVRRVLMKMEGRIFSAELFEQATLDLVVEKIYRIEKGLSPDQELDHIDYQAYIEDCASKHEELMQKHANNFAKKQKEEEDVAIQKEKERTSPDAGRDENSESGDDNTENA